jgi:hypothetical protein
MGMVVKLEEIVGVFILSGRGFYILLLLLLYELLHYESMFLLWFWFCHLSFVEVLI